MNTDESILGFADIGTHSNRGDGFIEISSRKIVPTLGQWGIMILMILLMIVSVVVIRNKEVYLNLSENDRA